MKKTIKNLLSQQEINVEVPKDLDEKVFNRIKIAKIAKNLLNHSLC